MLWSTEGNAGAGEAGSQTTAATAAPAENAQGITPAAAAALGVSAPAVAAPTLATFRAAIVSANPDAIPELIAGSDFAAIAASVEGAKAAYASVAARIKPEGQQAAAPSVPAGGGAAPIVNVDALPAASKIAHGLAMRRKTG
jgi:hypothetical protein